MTGGIIALGIDPGFASTGIAVVRLDATDEHLLALEVVRTAKAPGAKKAARGAILQRDDDHRRCQEIARALLAITRQWRPDVICAEALGHVPITKRSGAMSIPTIATSKSGRVWGIVDTLAELYEVALLQTTAQAIKRKVAGAPSASKAEVQAALDVRFGGAVGRMLAPVRAKSQHEHPCDALGAIVALLDNDSMRLARAAATRGQG